MAPKPPQPPPPPQKQQPSPPPPFFPLASYTSLVGVHASLLLFTALFLPRTSLRGLAASLTGAYVPPPPPPPARSADRPQHPFLAALTADAPATLGWLCAGALVLQAWWAARVRAWADGYRAARLGAGDKRPAEEGTEGARVRALARRAGEAGAFALVVAGVYHAVLVLFGAPITSHASHTALLAALLSLLTALPAAYVYGPPFSVTSLVHTGAPGDGLTRRLVWVRLFAELSPATPIEVALVYPAVAALAGAWAGAIPLALDWDRPWQAYPLPPAYGALLGAVLGALAGCAVNNVRALAQLSRDRDAATAAPTRRVTEETRKKGQEAVEEMKRNVQTALGGLGGTARVEVKENKTAKKRGKK